MFLYKLITYSSISFIAYKIIKSKLKKNDDIKYNIDKEIILEKDFHNDYNYQDKDNDNKTNNIKLNKNEFDKNKLINNHRKNNQEQYENNKEQYENNQEQYENNQLIVYHNENILNKNKNEIDIKLLNLSKDELKNKINNQKILIESCIYNINTDNILIENNSSNNYIIYNFNVLPKYNYKVLIDIVVNNIDNIKIIISDEKNKYIYNHTDNIENYSYDILNGIKTFNFILDNNEFTFDKSKIIYIHIYFYNKSNIIIDNIKCNVLQRNIIKSHDSLIIYKVNNSIYPIFTNVCNILNYNEKQYDDNTFLFL
jgi:hypothetical protein